jgi:protein TonB
MSTAVAYRRHDGNRFLITAILISVALHAITLGVRFVDPDAIRFKSDDERLEIILVNKKGDKPVKATAIAQANLNGGGEHDTGRATSFLPASAQSTDGEVIEDPAATVAHLEAEQKKLLTQLQESVSAVSPQTPPTPQPVTDSDLASLDSLRQRIARQEAQLDRQIQDYNSRPRRGYIGPSTRAEAYAGYYRAWADKIERIGTMNYPEAARGHLYGSLILRVTLNPDGTIYNNEIRVEQGSGYPVLDAAAKRIVRMAAPYGRFPPDMRKDSDIYEIVARFAFTRDDLFEADVSRH